MSRKLGLFWCLPHELTIEIVPTPVRGSRNKGENIRIFPLWVLSAEAQLCLYPLTNVQTPSVREKPRCEGCALSGEKGREANITAESLPQHSRGPLSFSVRRSCSHSSQKPRYVRGEGSRYVAWSFPERSLQNVSWVNKWLAGFSSGPWQSLRFPSKCGIQRTISHKLMI